MIPSVYIQCKNVSINHMILLGDINMLNPEARAHELFAGLQMDQLINSATHITEHAATLIDIIATNSHDLI